ncbi:hypothetical protein [Breoghania sp. L-A4]|uniref:hypothetical protein n=1 Tax=Breoghania sp. L-A4 TaxID=2304600 RepID=UPI000E35BAC4|nr:hypothetical protein [Breoghania sp. L-A4]AXS42266.1 hypothetical protein D1F64_22595 [Breoghania sp. L-A4]
MSYTVERLQPPVPLIKAADHSTDHHRKGHDRNDPAHTEIVPHDDAEREAIADAAEDPAVFVDAHHEEAPRLDGVAAYQATAEHARQALGMRHEGARHLKDEGRTPLYPGTAPGVVYGPHRDPDEEHKINLAT